MKPELDDEAKKLALAKMAGRNPDESNEEESLEDPSQDSPEEELAEQPTEGKLDPKLLLRLLDLLSGKEQLPMDQEEAPALEASEGSDIEAAEGPESPELAQAQDASESPEQNISPEDQALKISPEEIQKLMAMFSQKGE